MNLVKLQQQFVADQLRASGVVIIENEGHSPKPPGTYEFKPVEKPVSERIQTFSSSSQVDLNNSNEQSPPV